MSIFGGIYVSLTGIDMGMSKVRTQPIVARFIERALSGWWRGLNISYNLYLQRETITASMDEKENQYEFR